MLCRQLVFVYTFGMLSGHCFAGFAHNSPLGRQNDTGIRERAMAYAYANKPTYTNTLHFTYSPTAVGRQFCRIVSLCVTGEMARKRCSRVCNRAHELRPVSWWCIRILCVSEHTIKNLHKNTHKNTHKHTQHLFLVLTLCALIANTFGPAHIA